MQKVKPVSGLLVMLCLLFSTNVLAEFSREYHETFPVEKGSKLYLRHGDGDAVFTVWEKNELQVDVYYRAAGEADDDKLFRVDFDQRDKQIYVTGKEFRDFWGSSGRRTYEYRYELKAPAYLLLDLRGDDGNVSISGWRNDITIDLSDGDIDLEDVRAGISAIDLEDGDLDIKGLEGELSVNCSDGDITLQQIRATFADIENQDGSLRITDATGKFRIRIADGNCRIVRMTTAEMEIHARDGRVEVQLDGTSSPNIQVTTSDGSIDLEIPENTDAELEISARQRDIRTGLKDARIEREEKNYFRAVLGSGKGKIDVSAHDGRVTVRQ